MLIVEDCRGSYFGLVGIMYYTVYVYIFIIECSGGCDDVEGDSGIGRYEEWEEEVGVRRCGRNY